VRARTRMLEVRILVIDSGERWNGYLFTSEYVVILVEGLIGPED
jgi:hypothetical protein